MEAQSSRVVRREMRRKARIESSLFSADVVRDCEAGALSGGTLAWNTHAGSGNSGTL